MEETYIWLDMLGKSLEQSKSNPLQKNKHVKKKTNRFLLVHKKPKTFLIYISMFLMENKDGF